MKIDLAASFEGKRVLLTGHTGFKGSWLSIWLHELGAQVFGFALQPSTSPSMFDICNIKQIVDHAEGDIRNLDCLSERIQSIKPDVIIHMAAQPLVRRSYVDPLETVSTNVMGTAHLLEAVRALDRPCVVVIVSSDKCYDNKEWIWGYRENDPIGGKDPYSMSKGAAELVTACWRDSFFNANDKVRLASARAGNVIGGGDWSEDRIVPDSIRAFSSGQPLILRNPNATRPWQHVLEPLYGYLLLAARMLTIDGGKYCSGWNFGPASENVLRVGDVVAKIACSWGSAATYSSSKANNPHEAQLLALNCDKAIHSLGWKPLWNIDQVVNRTVDWYRAWHTNCQNMLQLTKSQIHEFEALQLDRLQ
jgi:CDP-glucose 4,6-dehydratase